MSYSNIPTYKLSDDELFQLPQTDLIHRLKHSLNETSRIKQDHEAVINDFNKQMQVHLLEVRGLKDAISRMQEDNQELRDLCCFLDDERQIGRKLAKEWQKFGRYTSGVMHGEVGGYHEKLKELEERQGALIEENLELKQLCLYLENERLQLCKETSVDRDQGDGSSNSSTSSKSPSDVLQNTPSQEYVRQLEEQIQRLEMENQKLTVGQVNQYNTNKKYEASDMTRITLPTRTGGNQFFPPPDSCIPTPQPPNHSQQNILSQMRLSRASSNYETANQTSGKPEAVVHAVKVLEIHEQLSRPQPEDLYSDEMNSMQKAIIREMCNVVWRKLGDDVPSNHSNQTPS